VGDDDLVDVDIYDPSVGRIGLRDLVHVALGRQAAADVDELPDACVDQEPHRAGKELAHLTCADPELRGELESLLGRLAVDREVVLAAQVVVVHAGDVRGGGVEAHRF
jgi:hypothetical protein